MKDVQKEDEYSAMLEIAQKAEQAHIRLSSVVESLRKAPKTKKNDLLLYLLSGRPTSMLLALKMFQIGCYRDVIYDLKQEGWEIGSYEGKSEGSYGTTRYRWHYIKAFPIEYVRSKQEL